MADSKLSMLYNLRQMNNSANKSNLLWFPKCYRKDTLNMRGMAAHIADHGSPYTRDTVLGVLTAFRDCLVEIVSQGNGVKLDGLGTFYPTLESKGAESPVGYNINEYLRGVHIRFLPESAAEDDITSRVLKKAVVFKQNMIFDRNGVPKKVADGKLVDYTGEPDDDDSGDNGDDNNDNNGDNTQGGTQP